MSLYFKNIKLGIPVKLTPVEFAKLTRKTAYLLFFGRFDCVDWLRSWFFGLFFDPGR